MYYGDTYLLDHPVAEPRSLTLCSLSISRLKWKTHSRATIVAFRPQRVKHRVPTPPTVLRRSKQLRIGGRTILLEVTPFVMVSLLNKNEKFHLPHLFKKLGSIIHNARWSRIKMNCAPQQMFLKLFGTLYLYLFVVLFFSPSVRLAASIGTYRRYTIKHHNNVCVFMDV